MKTNTKEYIMDNQLISAIVGGVLIGMSASLLMLFTGKIAGISGIAGGLLKPSRSPIFYWRLFFLSGLIGAGALLSILWPELFMTEETVSVPLLAVAGLFVGIGTALSNGCTSGHGVCGLGQLSIRSATAVGVFLTTGIITTLVLKFI